MFPLLAVALILWFGFFAFMLFVDRRVARLEKQVAEAQQRRPSAPERQPRR